MKKPVIVSHIVNIILRFWYTFIRLKELRIPPETEELLQTKGGFILAGWHNQILSLALHCSKYLQKKRGLKVTPLVSLSKDGEYIYETFMRIGMESVRGSSSRGGASGFRALLKTLKERRVPIFTPDGPRGPLYKLQEGVVQIASMTGQPIVAFYSLFDRYYEAKSWDRHRFPKFFARQKIIYSKPFYVPKGIENFEEERARLEKIMLDQMKLLDEEGWD